MYVNPPAAIAFSDGMNVPKENLVEAIAHFEDFFEDVSMELSKFGPLEEICVSDNIGEHMIGNVYAKFEDERDAEKAFAQMHGRYYDGRLILCEFSPVTDFREAKCRQYTEGHCDRGGYCNFLHPKKLTKEFRSYLTKQIQAQFPDHAKRTKRDERRVSSKERSHRPRSRSNEKRAPRREDRKDQRHPRRDDRRDDRRRDERPEERRRDDRPEERRRDDRPEERRRDDRRDPEEDFDRKVQRQSSAERRAMIASWQN